MNENTTKPSLMETIHLIPENMDVSLCEIGFAKRFYIENLKIAKLIPKDEFLTIDQALKLKKICQTCKTKLTSIIKYDRADIFASYVRKQSARKKIIPDNKTNWVQTICPGCGTSVGFYNNHKKQEHFCTVCNKMVKLPQEVVA
jgi:hypothetical protein